MKKLILILPLVLACSGCATAYSSSRSEFYDENGNRICAIKERSWITSMASKSNANKAKAGGIVLERSSTEAQPEVIESIVKGAVKGAVGK